MGAIKRTIIDSFLYKINPKIQGTINPIIIFIIIFSLLLSLRQLFNRIVQNLGMYIS